MTAATAKATPVADDRPALSADDLARMSIDELTDLYKRGTVPESFEAFDGSPPGRMLTIAGPLGRGAAAAAIRRFAASRRFPWGGKSFQSRGDQSGTGINRVRLGVRRDLFPFETSVEPSAIDGEPCVYLEYDVGNNPWFIRKIHDEIREVAPNLFMGPAMWKTDTDPVLVLYFAIDHTGTGA